MDFGDVGCFSLPLHYHYGGSRQAEWPSGQTTYYPGTRELQAGHHWLRPLTGGHGALLKHLINLLDTLSNQNSNVSIANDFQWTHEDSVILQKICYKSSKCEPIFGKSGVLHIHFENVFSASLASRSNSQSASFVLKEVVSPKSMLQLLEETGSDSDLWVLHH